MKNSSDQPLIDALLDSWDRNNAITINLLRAIADDAMDLKPIDTSPSIAQLFAHMDYCRLIFVVEDAPEFAREMRNNQWKVERDRTRLDTALSPERLVWTNISSELFVILALEAWVRCWTDRLAAVSSAGAPQARAS